MVPLLPLPWAGATRLHHGLLPSVGLRHVHSAGPSWTIGGSLADFRYNAALPRPQRDRACKEDNIDEGVDAYSNPGEDGRKEAGGQEGGCHEDRG